MPELVVFYRDRVRLRPILRDGARPRAVRKGTWDRLVRWPDDPEWEGLDVLRPDELRALVREYPLARQALGLP